jgi:hypothetical protein
MQHSIAGADAAACCLTTAQLEDGLDRYVRTYGVE